MPYFSPEKNGRCHNCGCEVGHHWPGAEIGGVNGCWFDARAHFSKREPLEVVDLQNMSPDSGAKDFLRSVRPKPEEIGLLKPLIL